jgi:hypothetical protein
MARRTIEVDRVKLEAAIAQVEAAQEFTNRSALYMAVTPVYNRMSPPEEITVAVCTLRVTQWGLTCKTPFGKKGRTAMTPEQKAAMAAGRAGGRKSRAEKFADQQDIQAGFAEIKRTTPDRFEGIVHKLTVLGSMRAGVALKCLECSNFQTAEVRNCVIPSCGLYAFRPYKNKAGEQDVEDIEAVEEILEEAA